MGRAYRRTGDTYKSVAYYEKGIRLLESQKEYRSLYIQLINSAVALNEIKEEKYLQKSLENLERAKSLFFSDSEVRRRRKPYTLYSGLANYYLNELTFDFQRSKYYYNKILETSIAQKDSISTSTTYSNLGELYLKEKNDSALYVIEKAIDYSANLSNKLVAYKNKAVFKKNQLNLDEALKDVHKGLSIYFEINNDFKIQPTTIRLYNAPDKRYVFESLVVKADILINLGLTENSSEYLKETINTTMVIDELISIMYDDSVETDSKFRWRRIASKAYLYGAYAAHLLEDSEKVFFFMEKSKALLLSESVLKNTEFANLPRQISQQETSYQQRIYDLKNKLAIDEGDSMLQDSLFYAKLTHENYLDSLKKVFPKYFARKINLDQVSLSEVQQILGDDEAILSYIWNDFDMEQELIIGLLATKAQTKTFKIKNSKELRLKLRHYRELISQPFETREEQTNFQTVAYQIFADLIPNEVQSPIQEKNLIIIPDGDLQNIPFESLITNPQTTDYLILNGDINYSYSYSFLKNNDKVNRTTKENFIGYSPSTFESLSLANLVNSQEEVSKINAELKGKIRLENTATKEDFLQNSKHSKIIHLATHADVGGNPWIAFADEKLELYELYTYKNNADLVTLSACNTSLGELAKGEGVLSLARGFFYSGSKSVVSSLWEVNDKSTAEIMTSFYTNIKKGQTKSEAINNAKRTYLLNHSLSEKSPYYWSSFILIGDAGEIDLTSDSTKYVIAIIVVLVILILFLVPRTKSKLSSFFS